MTKINGGPISSFSSHKSCNMNFMWFEVIYSKGLDFWNWPQKYQTWNQITIIQRSFEWLEKRIFPKSIFDWTQLVSNIFYWLSIVCIFDTIDSMNSFFFWANGRFQKHQAKQHPYHNTQYRLVIVKLFNKKKIVTS